MRPFNPDHFRTPRRMSDAQTPSLPIVFRMQEGFSLRRFLAVAWDGMAVIGILMVLLWAWEKF